MGRPLRLGMVGGAPGALIAQVHRTAAKLDDRFELVASVASSDPVKARAAAGPLGLAADRAYGTLEEMLAQEAAREDGIEVVAVVTPNDSHYPICVAALAAGRDVICDKPLTNTLDDARDLVRRVGAAGTVFCLTHNYSGYPMARQARAMVAAGDLGEIRQVFVEYSNGSLSRRVEDGDMLPRLRWRLDPARSGPSLVLGDIGTHAHQLACFVTGQQLASIAADPAATVPGRVTDDFVGALLRFAGGARGVMWVTNSASGAENALAIRVFGSDGGLEWRQNQPNHLVVTRQGEPARTFSRGHADLLPPAVRVARTPPGHPEGFQEGFANLYADAAEAIAARRAGTTPDPLALDFPSVEDGARGVAFVAAALASRDTGGWVELETID